MVVTWVVQGGSFFVCVCESHVLYDLCNFRYMFVCVYIIV